MFCKTKYIIDHKVLSLMVFEMKTQFFHLGSSQIINTYKITLIYF